MDKLKLAHEYALEMAKKGIPLKSCKELGWKYADAMQAEADKRKPSGLPDVLCEVDWRVAPKDATHYVIFADGLAYWYKAEKLECFDIAPSFGIVGLYVVERPHGF